jgi:hypothetical protein
LKSSFAAAASKAGPGSTLQCARRATGAGSIFARYHSLSTSQIDHPQISLGGGVKANTLCNGNDARRTRKSRQPASALRTNVAGAKSVEGAAR